MNKTKLILGLALLTGLLVAAVGYATIQLGTGSIDVQQASTQGSLVGHWDFNGDVKDRTPYGNNGTASGTTAVVDRKGQTDKALVFDDTIPASVYIDYAENLDITPNLSISAWINISDLNAYNTLVSKRVGGGGGGATNYQVYFNGAAPLGRLSWYDLASGEKISTYIPTVGVWTHIVATVEGTALNMYADGMVVHTDTITAVSTNTASLGIGVAGDYFAEFFNGSIDNVRLYNRVLSQTEITRLYESYDGGIQQSSLSKGLKGHWDFNGDVKDRTPYVNHGTASGTAVVADRKGQADKARSFDGAGDLVNVGTDNSLKPASAITFELWFKAPTASGVQHLIGDLNQSPPSGCELHMRAAGTIWFQCGTGAAYVSSQSSVRYDDNVWHHIVATWSGGTLDIYVDGKEISYFAQGSTASYSVSGFSTLIGASNYGNYFNGTIDDFRIYNRALTQTEITRLYESY